MSTPSRSDTARWLWASGLALSVTVLDLATKTWARHLLHAGHTPTMGPLRLQLVANPGATFGLGSSHPVLVAGVAAVVTALALRWLARAHEMPHRLAWAALVGGALGNLLDRVAHGAVTDWIHLSGYPATFNLADLAIRGGALVAIVLATRHQPGRAPDAPATHDPSAEVPH